MSAIDTPDYQFGIVNPQTALMTGLAGNGTKAVVIPPNTETLVIVGTGHTGGSAPKVTGVTSGIVYPAIPTPSTINTTIGTATFFVDVSASLDSQVTIQPLANVISQWSAYADAGVHVVADVSTTKNIEGIQYVIGVPPSSFSGDHPANELSVVSFSNTATATRVAAAPPAGFRYRVFYADLWCTAGGGGWANYTDTASGQPFLNVGGAGDGRGEIDFKPSGLPLTSAGAIQINSTAGNMHGNVVLTEEQI